MRLLLHACCGPCSLEPVRLLQAAQQDITIAYINSNIHPYGEYLHRRDTLLAWASTRDIAVIEGDYDADAWLAAADETARCEGASRADRCRACYRLRFEEVARCAAEQGFEGISTTLTVSPYQFTDIIGEELRRAADAYGLAHLFEDYRPYYTEATRISRDLGMYRQNYCGCSFSMAEAEAERAERKCLRKERKARLRAERADRQQSTGNDMPQPPCDPARQETL